MSDMEQIGSVTDEELEEEQLKSAARLIVTLAAQVAMVFSWTIDADAWIAIAITAVDLYLLVRHLWWKNNNVTKEAVASQRMLDGMRKGNGNA